MKRCLACSYCFDSETWRCPRCGNQPACRDGLLRFANDPDDAGAGFKPEYFPRLARLEEENFWFQGRNQLIQWALGSYFPNAESFFEVGCGTGFVLVGIRKNFAMHVSGSEIFSDGLAFAQSRLRDVTLYQMDVRRIPFQDEFDVIGAFDVLEHIAEDELALAQIFNATRAGGGIILTVPQHRFLWSASDDYAMHQRRYRRSELRQKVEEAGFQIERITSFISLLLPLMICSRMQGKCERDLQPWREFEISPRVNQTLYTISKLERAMIQRGVSFPAGGSLLLVGRKPAVA